MTKNDNGNGNGTEFEIHDMNYAIKIHNIHPPPVITAQCIYLTRGSYTDGLEYILGSMGRHEMLYFPEASSGGSNETHLLGENAQLQQSLRAKETEVGHFNNRYLRVACSPSRTNTATCSPTVVKTFKVINFEGKEVGYLQRMCCCPLR